MNHIKNIVEDYIKALKTDYAIVIAGRSYDAIGNVNLLGLPRHQVHCRVKMVYG